MFKIVFYLCFFVMFRYGVRLVIGAILMDLK